MPNISCRISCSSYPLFSPYPKSIILMRICVIHVLFFIFTFFIFLLHSHSFIYFCFIFSLLINLSSNFYPPLLLFRILFYKSKNIINEWSTMGTSTLLQTWDLVKTSKDRNSMKKGQMREKSTRDCLATFPLYGTSYISLGNAFFAMKKALGPQLLLIINTKNLRLIEKIKGMFERRREGSDRSTHCLGWSDLQGCF